MEKRAVANGKYDLVVFPDGKMGKRPVDGTIFIDHKNLHISYQWDDYKGDVFTPPADAEEQNNTKEQILNNCECGARSVGSNQHYSFCPAASVNL